MASRPLLLYHWARHLKGAQIRGHVWRKLYRPRAPRLGSCPGRRKRPVEEPRVSRPASMCAPAGFTFLDQTHEILDAADWQNPQWPQPWLARIHCFDDLRAADADQRRDWQRDLMKRWAAENPAGRGLGWRPDLLAIRIGNWIKWFTAGNKADDAVLQSLYQQAGYLARALEYHHPGYRLPIQLAALYAAGHFFEGTVAERWRRIALPNLLAALEQQVLADGGHYQRAPMLHLLVLESLLDVLALIALEEEPPAESEPLRGAAGAMLHWLRAMCHPDGGIALFNDSALDGAAQPAELHALARHLDLATEDGEEPAWRDLRESGFFRVSRGPMLALLELGALGPDHLPEHAHAGTLGFELSWLGERLLVDSGVSSLEAGPQRDRCRATAAHNTLEVEGLDSSEVWHGDRVATRAAVVPPAIEADHDHLLVTASHDGYTRLPGVGSHTRSWEFRDDELTVTDSLEGSGNHRVRLHWHLHPGVSVETGNKGVSLRRDGRVVARLETPGQCKLEVGEAPYHPHLGGAETAPHLILDCSGNLPGTWRTRFRLQR